MKQSGFLVVVMALAVVSLALIGGQRTTGMAVASPIVLSLISSSSQPTVGSHVQIQVRISAPQPISGYQFDLSFSPTQLRNPVITEGPFFSSVGSSFFVQPRIEGGRLNDVAGAMLGPAPAPQGEGILATIDFEVQSAGTNALVLSNVLLTDADGNALPSAAFRTTELSLDSTAAAVCGNTVLESGEQCDPPGTQACQSGQVGLVTCSSNCLLSSTCTVPQQVCGNNVPEGTEVCDGEQQCTSNGYPGAQVCKLDCSGFEACRASQRCGDGQVNGPEVCDGNTEQCTTSVGAAGTRICNAQCSAFGSCTVPTPPTCTDSDGGLQYTTAGNVRGSNAHGPFALADRCENTMSLFEYYCKGTAFATTKYTCANGCANGKCNPRAVPPPSVCTDSDAGQKYFTSGFVAVTGHSKVYDSCTTVHGIGTLTEYYCAGSQVKTVSYRCAQGCGHGACNKPESLLQRFRNFLFH